MVVDERDMGREREWFYEERAKMAIAGLRNRGANAQYVPSKEEALPIVLGMIPEGVTVARGDSVTLEQVGVISALRERNRNIFINPFETKPDGTFAIETNERMKLMKEAFTADIFITGTNAVTLDGKLVNTDSLGNRVAPMLFGPDKVIVVAGANKIVKDTDEARERIREVAAPVNARRHLLKHQATVFGELACVRTGKCVDCQHERRICNITVIIEAFRRQKERMNVVLVGEELGI